MGGRDGGGGGGGGRERVRGRKGRREGGMEEEEKYTNITGTHKCTRTCTCMCVVQ